MRLRQALILRSHQLGLGGGYGLQLFESLALLEKLLLRRNVSARRGGTLVVHALQPRGKLGLARGVLYLRRRQPLLPLGLACRARARLLGSRLGVPQLLLQPPKRRVLVLEALELGVQVGELLTEPRRLTNCGAALRQFVHRPAHARQRVGRVVKRPVQRQERCLGRRLPPRQRIDLCLERLDHAAYFRWPFLGRHIAKRPDDLLERFSAGC